MIIAFSGPSGIGKGYVKERLLRLYPHIQELSWLTTRPLRLNERSDGNRMHVSVSEFERMNRDGQLVLVQRLFGHYYGLRAKDLLPTSTVKLTELHPDNILEALKINPAIIIIGFVTFEPFLLSRRLTVVRKTESLAEIQKRTMIADGEIETILRQRSLFASVVEVIEGKEHLVFDEVLAILNPLLEKGG